MKRIAGKLLRGLGYILLAFLVLGSFLSVPRGGHELVYVGQGLISFLGGPIIALLVLGMGLVFWRWRRSHDRLALAMTILTGCGLAAAVFTFAGYVGVARSNGLPVDWARIFWPGPTDYQTPRPVSHVYDHYEGEEVRLFVYAEKGAAKDAARKPGAPVLVYIHGGGWVHGSASDRHNDMQWFARQGYVVIGLDYTLSSSRRHLWDVTQPQIGCALAWIGQNAFRLGGDPARIMLFGESAGGNLVLNAGGLATRGELASRCGGTVPRMAAIMSLYPPVDLAALYRHEPARQYALAYIGGSHEEYPVRYATVSPVTHGRGKAPPTLILTGLNDSLVPVSDTLRYVDIARSAGQNVDLITVPRAGHGFDLVPGSIGRQIFRQSMKTFLERRGLVP